MLNSHRDFRRNNRAHLAVQGAIFGKINKASIEKIQKLINTNVNIRVTDRVKKN